MAGMLAAGSGAGFEFFEQIDKNKKSQQGRRAQSPRKT
jgi:hypothetical protein